MRRQQGLQSLWFLGSVGCVHVSPPPVYKNGISTVTKTCLFPGPGWLHPHWAQGAKGLARMLGLPVIPGTCVLESV